MNRRTRRPYRRSILVWAALMALLLLSFGSAWLKLGAWNGALNLGIALAKALLVALFFMRLRRGTALLRSVALTALFTLALLFSLSSADYATRAVRGAPWQGAPPK